MAKTLSSVIVFVNGKKINIPDPKKIIVAVRGPDRRQHQATMDVNIPNIDNIKRVAVRRKKK